MIRVNGKSPFNIVAGGRTPVAFTLGINLHGGRTGSATEKHESMMWSCYRIGHTAVLSLTRVVARLSLVRRAVRPTGLNHKRGAACFM